MGRRDGLTFVSCPSAPNVRISTLKYAKLTHAITDEFCTSISHLMHNREGQSIQEDDDEHGGRSENHGNGRETERRN